MAGAAQLARSVMSDSFGARLRAHREEQRIGLATIAHKTKIKASLFESLERDDTSAWPSGIFRRAFVRAYAEAIGLDPEPVVREFLQHFPDPADERQEAATPGSLRLTLDDSEWWWFERLRVRPLVLERWQRGAAAMCDITIVLGTALLAFAVAGHFWTPFTIATVCYYFGGVLAFGNSPGVWLVARPRARVSKPELFARVVAQPVIRARDTATNIHPFPAREYDKAV
jgi:transcriptional regulator with XRE-family HTH domain